MSSVKGRWVGRGESRRGRLYLGLLGGLRSERVCWLWRGSVGCWDRAAGWLSLGLKTALPSVVMRTSCKTWCWSLSVVHRRACAGGGAVGVLIDVGRCVGLSVECVGGVVPSLSFVCRACVVGVCECVCHNLSVLDWWLKGAESLS